ncbi:hypothetical protein [Lutibacter sp.]
MKLTSQQIQYIDDYLKHHKIGYWDVRIEILDHIVNDIEYKMNKGISFNESLIEAHKSFGNSMKMLWNTGIEYSIFANGEGYKNLLQKKKEQTNKKYRKLYFKSFFNLFKSAKTLSVILLLVALEYTLFNTISSVVLKKINVVLFFVPMLITFVIISFQYLKKNNSINLEYATFYVTLSFLVLNMLLQLSNFLEFKEFFINKNLLFSIISVLNLLFFYTGFKMYLASIKKYNNLYEKLKNA